MTWSRTTAPNASIDCRCFPGLALPDDSASVATWTVTIRFYVDSAQALTPPTNAR